MDPDARHGFRLDHEVKKGGLAGPFRGVLRNRLRSACGCERDAHTGSDRCRGDPDCATDRDTDSFGNAHPDPNAHTHSQTANRNPLGSADQCTEFNELGEPCGRSAEDRF